MKSTKSARQAITVPLPSYGERKGAPTWKCPKCGKIHTIGTQDARNHLQYAPQAFIESLELDATKPHPALPGIHPSDKKKREIIRKRKVCAPIPEASWGLTISKDPLASLQAIWYDKVAKPSYRYRSATQAQNKAANFDRVLKNAVTISNAKKRIKSDLSGRGASKTRVAAAAGYLIAFHNVRVGMERFAATGTYGAASLLREHIVSRSGSRIKFMFRGKYGVTWSVSIKRPEFLDIVSYILNNHDGEPGDRLWSSEKSGVWKPVTSRILDRYFATLGATPKDFRTYNANKMFIELALGSPPPQTKKAAKAKMEAIVKEIGEYLGHKKTSTTKTMYLDPTIMELYQEGKLKEDMKLAGKAGSPMPGRLSDSEYIDFLQKLRKTVTESDRGEPVQLAADVAVQNIIERRTGNTVRVRFLDGVFHASFTDPKTVVFGEGSSSTLALTNLLKTVASCIQ